MRTHNYHIQYKKENNPKTSQTCSYKIFSKGLKNEFETAVVNEPSVFEQLKVYCSSEFFMKRTRVGRMKICSNNRNYEKVNRIYHRSSMHTEKSQSECKWIMPETRFTEVPALSVDPRVGISRYA